MSAPVLVTVATVSAVEPQVIEAPVRMEPSLLVTVMLWAPVWPMPRISSGLATDSVASLRRDSIDDGTTAFEKPGPSARTTSAASPT